MHYFIKKRYFLAIFIVLIFFIYSLIHLHEANTEKDYLNHQTELINAEYKVIYNKYKDIANIIFTSIINKPFIIEKFAKRERKNLEIELQPQYKELKAFYLRQLHFHLPNNDSFLRMHRPSKFGDNLSNARPTVKYVNEHLQAIDGFEEGRIFNGFRFVYPLFDKKKHIGSVEVSFSALAFIRDIVINYKIDSNFHIEKKIVNEKVFKDEKSNYIQSPFPEFLCQKSILKFIDLNLSDIKQSSIKLENFYTKIKDGKPFSSDKITPHFITTIIPIKNPITDEVNAIFTFKSDNKLYENNKYYYLTIFFISSLIIALILIMIYKELKYKVTLEKDIAHKTKELEELASTDPMTHLLNRRAFFNIADPLFTLAQRDEKSICVIMLDIDKFKNVNDMYGHGVGDDVIIFLADKMKELTRKSDIISRWGGEEFVILLPETDMDGAKSISQKIRKNIEKNILILEDKSELKFTISLGISKVDYTQDISIEQSIDRADKALYEAKESGRNKVCVNIL